MIIDWNYKGRDEQYHISNGGEKIQLEKLLKYMKHMYEFLSLTTDDDDTIAVSMSMIYPSDNFMKNCIEKEFNYKVEIKYAEDKDSIISVGEKGNWDVIELSENWRWGGKSKGQL